MNLISLSIVFAVWILSYNWNFELFFGLNFTPWRLLLLTYTLPGIIGGLILLIKLRPSTKFLLSIDRKEEALEVVKWMYRENKGGKSEFHVGGIISEDSNAVKGR